VANIVLAAFDSMKLTYPDVELDLDKFRKQLESDNDTDVAEGNIG
jgi:hypothetical protein